MIRKILTYPENMDILTTKSQEVVISGENKEDVSELIQDLKDTLHNTKSGVGISAVQIGVLKRVCIVRHNGQDIAMINPIITRMRGEVDSQEGCLSAPEKYGTFKRAEKVWCEYYDENGNKKEIAEGGFVSKIIQHELDHFEGWCVVFDLVKED